MASCSRLPPDHRALVNKPGSRTRGELRLVLSDREDGEAISLVGEGLRVRVAGANVPSW